MATPPARTDLSDTYPNPSNATFRTGIGAFWDYVTGLLGSTGNAAEARAALGIGNISNRNLLVNANGAINQRGYISGAATGAANQYTLDRWRVVVSGQSLAFGAASPGRTLTAPAGGVEQVIEAAAVDGGTYTLSWTGTATATVNGSAIANGANTGSLSANANVTVRFSGGTVTNPQFEKGTVATPFERPDPALELLKCMRRFQAVKGAAPIATGGWTTSTTGAVSICLRFARMASAPTVNATNGTYTVFDGTTQASLTVINAAFATEEAIGFDVSVASGLTAGRPATLYVQTGALWLSAEL